MLGESFCVGGKLKRGFAWVKKVWLNRRRHLSSFVSIITALIPGMNAYSIPTRKLHLKLMKRETGRQSCEIEIYFPVHSHYFLSLSLCEDYYEDAREDWQLPVEEPKFIADSGCCFNHNSCRNIHLGKTYVRTDAVLPRVKSKININAQRHSTCWAGVVCCLVGLDGCRSIRQTDRNLSW